MLLINYDDYTTYEVANVLKLFSYNFFCSEFSQKDIFAKYKLIPSQNISTWTNTAYIKSNHNKN